MPRSSVDLSYAIGLKPEEAIRYFEQKGYAIGFNYHEVWAQAHARAFTVAGVLKLDVLTDIKTALKQALNDGKTLRQFEQSLLPTLTQKGWIGNGLVAEPTTGELQGKQLTPRRMETIFQTNMQSSYMAGRYQTMKENVDNRPFWQYWAIMDKRTRPAHALLNGRVFRFDDPIWNIIFPPNGYRCRCSVRAFNQGDLDKRSLAVSTSDGHLVDVEQPIGNTGLTRTVTAYKDPVTGQYFVPDAGFGFNPGQVAYQPELDKYPLDVARQYVHGTLTGDEFAAWYQKHADDVSAARTAQPSASANELVNAVRSTLVVGQRYPVAVLSDEFTSQMGVNSQTVWLSDDTLVKQLVSREGQNIGLSEYWMVQDVIEQAQLIVRQGDLNLVFIRRAGKMYHAAVKATQSGKALFLTSFRESNIKAAEQAMKRGDVIKNELD